MPQKNRATIKSEIKLHDLFTANPASARLSLLYKSTKIPIFLSQKIGNNNVGRNCGILVSGQLTAHLHHSWKVQVIFHSSGSAQIRVISRSQTFLVVTDQDRPFAVYLISLINFLELWANTTSEGVKYLRGSTNTREFTGMINYELLNFIR
jgi:hypothetical protein